MFYTDPWSPYREEPCRTALNRVKGMPFAWSLNPYTGCAHRCTFCYVRGFEQRADRPVRRPLRANDPRQGQRRRGAPQGARAQVVGARGGDDRRRDRPVPARRGTLPAHAGVHRRALPSADALSIITRGPMVWRDVDVLQEAARRVRGLGQRLGADPRRPHLAHDRARHRAAPATARDRPPPRRRGHPHERRDRADPARALRPPGAAHRGRRGRTRGRARTTCGPTSSTSGPGRASISSPAWSATGRRSAPATRSSTATGATCRSADAHRGRDRGTSPRSRGSTRRRRGRRCGRAPIPTQLTLV